MSIQPPQTDGLEILEQYDTDMGANFETVRDELLEKTQQVAEDLGLSYEPDSEEYRVFFEKDNSKAILYAESWGGTPDIVAEITAFECETELRGRKKDIGARKIMLGNEEANVNEGALRGAAEYLNRKRTK